MANVIDPRNPVGVRFVDADSPIEEMVVTARREPLLKSTKTQDRFDIGAFRSEINYNGVLRNNRFLMFFTPPKLLATAQDTSYDHINTSFLTIRCETATVPGVNFFTTDNHRRYGTGQVERRPYLPQFNPITITFIVDRNARVIEYFNDWANRIINFDSSAGVHKENKAGIKPYRLQYKDDYISPQVLIWIYDEFEGKDQPNKQIGVKLFDVFPLATSDINVSWATRDDIVRYSVTLQYTDMAMIFPTAKSDLIFTREEQEDLQSSGKTTNFKRRLKNLVQGAILQAEETVVEKILSKF